MGLELIAQGTHRDLTYEQALRSAAAQLYGQIPPALGEWTVAGDE